MAPIWWSSLFIMFILVYLLMITNMYFFQTNKNLNLMLVKGGKMNKKTSNWKW